MRTACHLVYITASGKEEAMRLCRSLLEERLAACANIVDSVSSLYWWQGNLESAGESVCLLKTSGDRLDALIARARQLHSYTTPCIVAWPIAAGHEDFLAWIRAESVVDDKGIPGSGQRKKDAL